MLQPPHAKGTEGAISVGCTLIFRFVLTCTIAAYIFKRYNPRPDDVTRFVNPDLPMDRKQFHQIAASFLSVTTVEEDIRLSFLVCNAMHCNASPLYYQCLVGYGLIIVYNMSIVWLS